MAGGCGRGRVSSNFNPNRVHPILGYVRPHNGTDIAVPMGSNVLAGEAGKVVTGRVEQQLRILRDHQPTAAGM